jgi:[ribosomal protein S18]-alanine N-acetyltransferase
MNRYKVRWLSARDRPEVLAIENASFKGAWTDEDFRRCLGARNCLSLVAEQDATVVGFMIYERHETSLHILNFAVHPQRRRRKVGTALVDKMKSKLSTRRTHITMNVRETNLVAQFFFRQQGFRAVNVLHGYYEDTGEDAYLMTWKPPID